MTDEVMIENVETLAEAVIGHKIVNVGKCRRVTRWGGFEDVFLITLDNGKIVTLEDMSDCCAYTELLAFLLHPERVNHVITGVSHDGNYEHWHIYADMGDVLELTVGWGEGSGYYAYGFNIKVESVTAWEAEGRA